MAVGRKAFDPMPTCQPHALDIPPRLNLQAAAKIEKGPVFAPALYFTNYFCCWLLECAWSDC
jgi:hypothetical protein